MRDHEVPEEDRQEQEQPPDPDAPSEAQDPPPDAPEEDALEQGRREDPEAERGD